MIGLLSLMFFSCSTDVDLYADYKEIPIVYGLIEANSDTNYVKITKAFCGTNDNGINALETAQVYDSSNYPGKLNAYIVELKSVDGQSFQPTGRKFYLDTLTVHNKQPGVFYAPHQKLYYTTEPFNTNNGTEKYHYQLFVVKPDYDTIMAETGIVSGDIALGQSQVFFQSAPTEAVSSMMFTSTEEAVLYEIGMRFRYREGAVGQPLTNKELYWSYGARTLEAYEKVENTDNLYRLYYSVNTLFNLLERAIGNDTVWDENHPNVVRYIDDMTVFIAAAGEDFNNYYQYLQATQSGLSLSSEYSNVEGGSGLFSSRIFVRKKVTLSSRTLYDLFNKPWGFQEQ
jgi:hypothetical protein